jgi:hypothetical protein
MAGKFATSLFKPSIRRSLERGTSRTADITLSQGKFAEAEGTTFPSGTFRYDPAGVALKNVQQLNVDFSKFENHTFFNSAAAKTQIAFEKIVNQFPFDGSKKDLVVYRDRISGFDNYVLDQIPKNVGFTHFERGTSGLTDANGFSQGNFLEVKDYSGANIELFDAKDGTSILDPTGKSFCVEMQLYLAKEENDNEVIFQRRGEDTSVSAGQRHFGVTLALSESNTSIVEDVALTGSIVAILSSGSFAINTTMLVEKGTWNHIALNFNQAEDRIRLYRNSELVVTSSLGSFGVGAVIAPVSIGSGSNHAAFGTLFEPKQTLSGAIDEFRFWHSSRTEKQLNAFSKRNVFASPDLKLYYRFNEPSGSFGTAARSGNSSLVLDHSGFGLHTEVSNFDMSQREKRGLKLPLGQEREEDSPVLFPSFSTVISLNERLMTSASNYDLNNPNIITKLVPAHYLQEAAAQEGFESDIANINDGYGYSTDVPGKGSMGSPQVIAALLYTMAANMDELKMFVSEFSNLLKVDYTNDTQISDQFLPFLAKYYGLSLPNAFSQSTIRQLKDAQDLNLNSVKSTLSLGAIQNIIWRRILSDLPELMRTRGTRQSIEALLRNIGIRPNGLFRIREYGGSRSKNISDTFEKRTEIASMLDFSGSLNVSLDTHDPTNIDGLGFHPNLPSFSSGFLSGSRVEPGTPDIHGTIVNGVSNQSADGLFTSGSFSAESLFKFGGSAHLRKQSLFRLQTTGTVGTSLLYNAVALPPEQSKNITGSLVLYGRPHQVGGTALKMELTGVNVFDGDKWHVSFGRTRQDFNNSIVTSSYFFRAGKMTAGRMGPLASTTFPYDDFSGTVLGTKSDQWNASGSFLVIGSQSLDYTAAHLMSDSDETAKTTFFSGKVSGVRFYSKALTETETISHIKNFKSIGTEDPLIHFGFNTGRSGSFERLRADVHIDQPITMSNSSGEINLFDFSQNKMGGVARGFEPNKRVIKPERFDYEILSPRFELAVATNKVRIRSFRNPNNIKKYGGSLAPLYEIPQDEVPMDDRRLSVDISSVQALNEDIVNILATLEFFDNAIGAPELVFAGEYRDLRALRQQYFNRLQNKLSLEKFFRFYKWFDDTVGDLIEEFLPSSTNYLGTNFIIESHMLERSKFQYNYHDMYVGEIERLEQGTIYLQQFLANLRKF